MSDEEDFPDSTDDEDYVPSEGEAVSEEENSGDEENLDALKEDGEPIESGRRKRKSPKKKTTTARKRRGGIKLEDEKDDETAVVEEKNVEMQHQIVAEKEAKKEEQTKKRADDLWSSFMADVGKRPEKKAEPSSARSLASIMSKAPTPSESDVLSSPVVKPPSSVSQSSSAAAAKSTITVTKVYDFAGEAIQVTKELDLNSKEAKAELRKQQEDSATSSTDSPAATGGLKRPSAGGLGGVLEKINKRPKIGTLEKSKLDWESFKQKEGIEEELKIHNRGKQSYIERMNFLQRTDQRQYEIERNLRLGSSTSKR